MKRIQILTAVFLAGSILFAGCTKDNMDTLDTTAITSGNQQNIAPFSVITYKLAVNPVIEQLPVQWKTGYMTIGALIFDGSNVNSSIMNAHEFQTNTITMVNLFEPTVLGSISLQSNSFTYGMFSLQLDPASQVSLSSSTVKSVDPANPIPVFSLSGTFRTNGTAIPVQVTINTPLMLTSAWLNNISNTATLALEINSITNGITTEMLVDAQQTNGTIFITNSSNENLYGMILQNLQNNTLQVQLSSTPTTGLTQPNS